MIEMDGVQSTYERVWGKEMERNDRMKLDEGITGDENGRIVDR